MEAACFHACVWQLSIRHAFACQIVPAVVTIDGLSQIAGDEVLALADVTGDDVLRVRGRHHTAYAAMRHEMNTGHTMRATETAGMK